MADNNLDDFFAKRDKKKKTGKNKKFDTAEDLAKILGKKVEERKKMEEGKSQYVPDDGQPPAAPANEDDEWIDPEEKVPDLTGLKIQELILDSEDEEERKEQEVGVEGEVKTSDGVWGKKREPKAERKLSSTTEPPQPSPVNAEEEEVGDEDGSSVKSVEVASEPEKTANPPSETVVPPTDTPSEDAPAASGPVKYVPVHMRNKPQESVAAVPPPPPSSRLESGSGAPTGVIKGAYVPPGRRAGATVASVTAKPKRSGAAPSINDEESFPSLGGS